MALQVTTTPGGLQGGTYSPQSSSTAVLQGTSPTLQSASSAGLKLQNTSSPQIVHNFTSPFVPVDNTAANANLASGSALLQSIYGPPAPVYAPKLDLAAINANARKSAENNVNPFYTKTLNDFLTQQATEKSQQEAQTATNIKNLKDVLTNTTDANAVTGNRATEDTATKEANINQVADWRQTDQGGQYDIDRVAQAIQQSKSGLTGSGIAGGQQGASQDKFNTTESRQATTDQQAKDQAELAKARTFEDIATSNKIAGQNETKGEAQQNVNLTDFITNQGLQLNTQKSDLEAKRLQAVAQESQNQAKLAVNNFIASIANPAQRQAAYQAYGGAF